MATKTLKNIDQKLQPETKEPPNKTSNQSQTSENEDQKEITSTTEKKYLEGEPHNDPSSLDSNNLKSMKQISLKPRETYLKEKIEKINNNKKLINNIQKDIKTQVNEIKTEISDNKVTINEKTKDLNKLMERAKIMKEKNLVKYSDKEYHLRNQHKILSSLREEQNLLKSKLRKIEENESLLKSEGFTKMNNSFESEAVTPFDKSIKEQKMKNIRDKKNEIKERLIEIEFRIEQIIQKENDNNFSKKEKLENYKQTFERDKEILKARADKYLKENKERNKRIMQDIEHLVEKRKKEMEQREKKEEEKKKQIIDKFKEKEKEIERKRLNEKKLIMEKYMPFRKLKLDKKKDDYTYEKLTKKYLDTENNLIKKNNLERQIKMKMMTPEELVNFREQVDIKLEEIKQEKEKRDYKEKEKFEAAKNFKPSYQSKYSAKKDEEIKHNLIEERKQRKEKIEALMEKKNDFAHKKVHQPSINETKKKERLDLIEKIDQPKLFQVKYTLKNKEKKENPPEKKSLEWLYKLKKENEIKLLNNSAENENITSFIKRPKKILLTSTKKNKSKENISPKQFNYLEELRNQKGFIKKEKKETSNIKKEQNLDIINGLAQMKEKTDRLEKKALMGEELLRANGGISNNPKLGKQVSDLYIDSIGKKLKMLNQIYENDNEEGN